MKIPAYAASWNRFVEKYRCLLFIRHQCFLWKQLIYYSVGVEDCRANILWFSPKGNFIFGRQPAKTIINLVFSLSLTPRLHLLTRPLITALQNPPRDWHHLPNLPHWQLLVQPEKISFLMLSFFSFGCFFYFFLASTVLSNFGLGRGQSRVLAQTMMCKCQMSPVPISTVHQYRHQIHVKHYKWLIFCLQQHY